MSSLTIPITGMSCGGCVNNVKTALAKVPGVIEAQVKVGSATISYDPARTSPDVLRGTVAQAGYAVAAA